jgi:Uma2 family endonuclease
MKTQVLLGPKDNGRHLSEEEWEAASLEEGYRYEIIDGKIVVSPAAEADHEFLELWLFRCWDEYAKTHPEIVNYVARGARIYVPGHTQTTSPQPDLAAIHNYPFDQPRRQRNWRRLTPLFVAEIVSEGNADKDFTRNVDLYLQVPTIREYWILDPRGEQDRLLVYRRRGSRWQRVIEVAEGETYVSRLFPGLEVTLTGE